MCFPPNIPFTIGHWLLPGKSHSLFVSLPSLCSVVKNNNVLQSLELWNMSENKTMTLSAHDGLITALAVSTVNGLVASASHDKFLKLWK